MRVTISQRKSIKQYTAMAFVIAGVGRIGNETVHHFGTAVGLPVSDVVLDLTLLLTYGGALLGLLGIFFLTDDLLPRLSRTGVLLIGLTSGSIIASLFGTYVIGGESPQGILLLIPVSFYVFSTLSFLVFGIASLRTRVPSRGVGYLLLTVVISRVATVAGMGEFGAVLFIISMLCIGYLFRQATVHSATGISADETTA
jgi:hypothetical protein